MHTFEAALLFRVLHLSSICCFLLPQVRKWIAGGKNAVTVVRFLGTTPQSSSILSLLNSVCAQIARTYDVTFTPSDVISELVQRMNELLACATAKRPLVLLLDSLDQLSAANYAHKLSWLPWQLPPHCHVIVSTLPELYSILSSLRKRLPDANFVRVQSLGDQLGLDILLTWLKRSSRTLTSQQRELVTDSLKQCSLPLYTRLLYENAILWRSYDDVSALPVSVRGIIEALFERLEKAHGHLFVTRALGYMTASKNGLSDSELEDVLSLDDEVK